MGPWRCREGSSPRREDPPARPREHMERRAENQVPCWGVQGSREDGSMARVRVGQLTAERQESGDVPKGEKGPCGTPTQPPD